MREPSGKDLFYVEQIAALSTEGASADEIGEALELLSQRVLRLARRFGVKLLPQGARRRLAGLALPSGGSQPRAP